MSQSSPLGGLAVGLDGEIALPLLIEDAAEVDRAQLPVGNVFLGALGIGRAAALVAGLDDPLVLSRGLDQFAAFPAVVAQRRLDVNVLARLAGPNRRQAVPMVGRGDHHGVDRLVVQRLAEILHAVAAPGPFAAWPGSLLREGNRLLSTSHSHATRQSGRWAKAVASVLPRPRTPTTARPIRSLAGAAQTDSARERIVTPAAAARPARGERRKNSRRFIGPLSTGCETQGMTS